MKPKNLSEPIDITADNNFIQEVIQMITISGRLPFTVPTEHIPLQIRIAAKTFYKKYSEASEIKYYRLSGAEMICNGLNKSYTLPDYIIAISDIQEVNGPSQSLSPSRRSPSLIMLNALKFNEFANGTFSGAGYTKTQGAYVYDQGYGLTDALLALYESSAIESILTKGLRYNYNTNNNKLQILGSFVGDLVIECFEGIELRYLYNDENFLHYVTGLCLKNLKSVLGTFAFKMPGVIDINYDEYELRGQSMIDEVKELLIDDEPGDLFIIS